MGYKAEIKKLEKTIELKELQNDMLFAALKAIVLAKGNTDEGDWRLDVPLFQYMEINEKYEIETMPDEEKDIVRFTVREHEKT